MTFCQLSNGCFSPDLAVTCESMSLETYRKPLLNIFCLVVTYRFPKNLKIEGCQKGQPSYSPGNALHRDIVHAALSSKGQGTHCTEILFTLLCHPRPRERTAQRYCSRCFVIQGPDGFCLCQFLYNVQFQGYGASEFPNFVFLPYKIPPKCLVYAAYSQGLHCKMLLVIPCCS